jgi:hypothetical protein
MSACGLFGDDEGNVAIRFAVTPSGSSASSSSMTAFATAPAAAAQDVEVEGRNGTLNLERVVLIVDELELEGHGEECRRDRGDSEVKVRDDDDEDDKEHGRQCEFEADAFLLDLPVDGSPITIASDLIPDGVYDELEFRVRDVELDEDEDDEGVIGLLAAQLRSSFPNWPSRASALLQGTFEPAGGGAARPFTVFLDADLKVEMELEPPLVITEEGPSRVITVEVHPDLWFRRIDGSVVDLSAFDFERTGWIVRVPLFERGFRRSHHDD